MEIITLTKENLQKEHICCALSGPESALKKEWLAGRLDEGLIFKKGNVRGKCFIEYIPAEKAWAPIEAPDYMYIDCFWVSGQFKGQGSGALLLEECIRDSRQKGKKGLCVLSSDQKRPYLSDPDFLRYKGFQTADAASPFFELLYLPFEAGTVPPSFRIQARSPRIEEAGFVLYYTHQCPFAAKYAPLIQETALSRGLDFRFAQLTSREEAQAAPTPFTAYSLFYNGRFVTHEILSAGRFEKLLRSL